MITDLLALHAQQTPSKPLLVMRDISFSYAEIYSASLRFCMQLYAAGISEGDHVALIAPNGAAFLTCWFGINMAGAVAVPLNHELVGEGLLYAIEQSDSKLLVVNSEWLEKRGGNLGGKADTIPVITIASCTRFIEELQGWDEATPVKVPVGGTCTILYTSGSTGLPKGVLNSHEAYEAVGLQTALTVGLVNSDRILAFLPFFHANPQMFAIMSALTVGASIATIDKFSASNFFNDVKDLQANCFTFVGTVLSILAARYPDPPKDHGLRFCVGGGTPVDVWHALENRFGIKVYEGYGMTEIGCFAACNSVTDYRIGSCGKPRSDMEISIVDSDDNEVEAGLEGEIVVRPRKPFVIMSGYHKQPELTIQTCRNLWFHTGDRGYCDSDGFLFFSGREKDLIRRGGEMISPVEIEINLRSMPGIYDCAVVAVPDPIMGEEIKAVLVPTCELDPMAVSTFLAGKIPQFMVPRYVEFVEVLPKTETEKILRFKLQYLDASVVDLQARADGENDSVST